MCEQVLADDRHSDWHTICDYTCSLLDFLPVSTMQDHMLLHKTEQEMSEYGRKKLKQTKVNKTKDFSEEKTIY